MLRLPRRFAWILPAGVVALGVAVAQPPAEEEEPTPKRNLKKIVPVDDPPPLAAVPPGVYYARLDDLAKAATAARHPVLTAVFSRFAVAFDQATDVKNKIIRVTPTPLVFGKDKFPDPVGLCVLDDKNQPAEPQSFPLKEVRRVVPFEQVAMAAADKLLADAAKPPADEQPPLPAAERLAAAERLLTAVLFFHDSAREQNRRRGKSWEPVKAALYEKLTAARLARLARAVTDKDWAAARSQSARLTELYKTNAKVLEEVYAAKLAEAEALATSDKPADVERVRQVLADFDARYPNARNATATRIRQLLSDRAKTFFTAAERAAGSSPVDARNILKTVEQLDPDHPGLRQLQQQLRAGYGVLVVGTTRLPERMSPATARYDSERWAVELLFDGLTEPVPHDEVGVEYRPALALGRPSSGGGVRDLRLTPNALWHDRTPFDPADLIGTVRLLRDKPGTWAADPLAWLGDPAVSPDDPSRVRFPLRIGHPDPRGLFTFKVLPARALSAKNRPADDPEFARKPVGTGPFKLDDRRGPAGEVIFVADPAYGRRPGRAGQPDIKEIRFIDVSGKDVAELFRFDGLHLLTDVPTRDLNRLVAGSQGKIRPVTAAAPRRVHLLAVNHRRPELQSVDLRRGLAHAIDREKILNEVFREKPGEMHRPLTGPFPAGWWATPKPLGLDPAPLFDANLAAGKFKAAFQKGPPALTLTYPSDDAPSAAACGRIKQMVEAAAKEAGQLTLALEPLAPAEFHQRVYQEHRYDLAYVSFDYPTDLFPLGLGSLLDPSAVAPGERNVMGYGAVGTNPAGADERLLEVLSSARLYRDPAGKLTPLAHDIHRRFGEAMPFVPLWQLDRHTLIATGVHVFVDGRTEELSARWLDPTPLLTTAGRWRVD